jgi:predicted RNase H-like nuclease (RuvC/YqgF family)
MKIRIIILFCFCSSVFAEPDILPPIVDKSSYPQGSAYRKKSSVSPIYEVLNRLDQLQREVQQLRGQVEEQAYTIEGLKKQQQTMYKDLDDRLQKTETRGRDKKKSP